MSQPKSIANAVLVPDPLHPHIEMTLEPYNPEWACDFQRERQILVDAFVSEYDSPTRSKCPNFAQSIEHVGSTSIPNATAKPYIDLCIPFFKFHQNRSSKPDVDSFLERRGYRQYGNVHSLPHDQSVGHRYWYKPSQGLSCTCKGYFLHVTDFCGRTGFHLASFSECLASDASLVQQYNEAKRRILADHPRISFAEYTMLKTAFVMMVQHRFGIRFNQVPPTSPPLYELIHFITSAAAGHEVSMQPLPFAPNQAFSLYESAYAVGGYCQTFTPLGLALILALEPRLSALWDRYNPHDSHHIQIRNSDSPNFARLPVAVSPSDSKRLERLARFAPIICRLRQHGCTVASFLSWTSWESPTINAANAGGAEFGGIIPVNFGETDGTMMPTKFESLGFQIRDFFDCAPCWRSQDVKSAICLPELGNFGPSAAALFCGLTSIVRALDSVQLPHHLAAFIKENITDDLVGALSAENLRSLGLSLGDALRFSTAVQKELAALSSPPPLAPPVARTLKSSNFRIAHEKAADIVKKQHELFAAIDGFIVAMCRHFGVPSAAADDLFQRLQSESFENPEELLSQIQVAATRIWTSTQKLQGKGVDDALNSEFCSLINRALRDDIADVMPHLVVIVRAINALCIVRRESKSLKFPPNSESHRGGALPLQHHAFFTAGKKYRVPMYLATSFSEDKAYEFWCSLHLSTQKLHNLALPLTSNP
jgi:GrpB-like predicted nucleotidyltransferase (UPF0157 family)